MAQLGEGWDLTVVRDAAYAALAEVRAAGRPARWLRGRWRGHALVLARGLGLGVARASAHLPLDRFARRCL